METEHLAAALTVVLTDQALRSRCAAAGRRLRRRPGTLQAADLIERVATGGERLQRRDG
jgi:UDP:flavonoid glycosyltransferase YjiC (YdhE family)